MQWLDSERELDLATYNPKACETTNNKDFNHIIIRIIKGMYLACIIN